MSNIWSGISEGAKLLCDGIRIVVGSGKKTLFWDHKWLFKSPIIDRVTQEPPIDIAEATVEEIWEQGAGWKWDVFAPYLDQDTLKMIQAHEVLEDPEAEDVMYWDDGPKGKFSVSSAVRILRKEDT